MRTDFLNIIDCPKGEDRGKCEILDGSSSKYSV